MKFALLNDGVPVAFYSSDVHGQSIPAEAVKISDEQWLECVNNPGRRRIITDGDGRVRVEAYISPPPPMSGLFAAKLREINAACDAEVAALAAKYPDTEILSWYRQEREARELQANPQAVTPLIDNIAAQRGITREDLAGRILAKAEAYAQEAGAAFGRRQALEDKLEAIMAQLQAGEIDEDQARAAVAALSYSAA